MTAHGVKGEARAMDFQAVRDSVSFWHGSEPLAGDLVRPAGPGPYPAVAVVGGQSGPRDRTSWIGELAFAGLMTLSWDSPGWGGSPGAGTWQSPDRRAPELLAAVDYLATDPAVPAGGVGVVAADLGAWSAIMAAATSSRVQALVLLSPPLRDVVDHEVDRLGPRLRQAGFSAVEAQLAQAVLRSRLLRLRAGTPPDVVLAGEAACRAAPWYPGLPGGTPAELEEFAAVDGCDVGTLLSTLRCPVLAVFVERDQPAVWDDAQLARRYLDARGTRDHRVVVMPGEQSGSGLTWEVSGSGPRMLPEMPQDVVAVVTDWLVERVSRRRWARDDLRSAG